MQIKKINPKWFFLLLGCLLVAIIILSGINTDSCSYSSEVNVEELKIYSPIEVIDGYYNLIGTKENVSISPRNNRLKNFFSIKEGCGNYSKLNLTKPSESETIKRKGIIANYYLHDDSLSDSQKSFLFWHFTSPYNYSNSTIIFSHNSRDYVVGWNSNITSNNFDKIYTFGLIGCTCIICYSDDGNISVSHYDGIANPLQKNVVSDFSKNHNISRMYIIGNTGKTYFTSLNETPGYEIFLHEKKDFFVTYSVLISKKTYNNTIASPILIEYASLPITSDYIPSIHKNNYGRYFSEGNASEIFPPVDQQFHLLDFNKM